MFLTTFLFLRVMGKAANQDKEGGGDEFRTFSTTVSRAGECSGLREASVCGSGEALVRATAEAGCESRCACSVAVRCLSGGRARAEEAWREELEETGSLVAKVEGLHECNYDLCPVECGGGGGGRARARDRRSPPCRFESHCGPDYCVCRVTVEPRCRRNEVLKTIFAVEGST